VLNDRRKRLAVMKDLIAQRHELACCAGSHGSGRYAYAIETRVCLVQYFMQAAGQGGIQRAIALLHSFWLDEVRFLF